MKPNKQTTPDFWDEYRGVIRTRRGGWVIGEGVHSHGYSLLDELVGTASFFQVMMLNVTGKLPELRLAKWIEAAYICLSWPDPRIWCNQIGSLGGTVRTSPVAAICAGTLAADSSLYGQGTSLNVIRFITLALDKTKKGQSIEQIVDGQRKGLGQSLNIPGFARPIAKGDERVTAMERVTSALSFSIGDHLKLAYNIDAYIDEKYSERMNLAGYVFSFLLDQEFSADEIYRIFSLWVNGGIHACYAEAADRPSESFLPLQCEDIEYCGQPERQIPQATTE
jgi:citrate synthase